MDIKCLELNCNCYIVSDEEEKCVVFDIGAQGAELYDFLVKLNKKVNAVIITHAHFDHIAGLDDFIKAAENDGQNIPVYVHRDDASCMRSAEKNLSAPLFGTPYTYTGTLCEVNDGDVVKAENFEFEAISCPGHTDGCCVFVLRKEKCIFSGDVLFEGSIGRTDFPGGDIGKMKESLKKLMTLDDNFVVYPGHGGSTTIGDEKNYNPYIAGL